MAMHKPKKQKRFQDGGDVEEDRMKQRGLDASNKEAPVGFFQRLKMGNIDDPKSEAYKKFGAGRGRAESAPAAAPAATSAGPAAGPAAGTSSLRDPQQMAASKAASKATDGDVSAYDLRMEAAANAPRRAITSSSSSTPKPSVSKAPVKPKTSKPAGAPGLLDPQQKAQQKDKGPYRNEGRNTPAPAAPAAPEKRPGTALPINPSILKQREEAEKKREAARSAKRKAEEDEKKARPAKEAAERKALSEQPGAVAYRKKQEERDKMSPGQRSAARGRAIKDFFGLKKGGSVSSASKRADGIAQRGKTRGRMY